VSIPEEKYNMSVEQLDLSVRTMNCLRRGGISTVGELMSRSEQELLSLRNFGQKSKQELEERLNTLGLSLTPQVEEKVEEEKPVQQEETVDLATENLAERQPI
jgi:DNA-directed RNA polymerase subunit alpha